jgi:hypothetical protein
MQRVRVAPLREVHEETRSCWVCSGHEVCKEKPAPLSAHCSPAPARRPLRRCGRSYLTRPSVGAALQVALADARCLPLMRRSLPSPLPTTVPGQSRDDCAGVWSWTPLHAPLFTSPGSRRRGVAVRSDRRQTRLLLEGLLLARSATGLELDGQLAASGSAVTVPWLGEALLSRRPAGLASVPSRPRLPATPPRSEHFDAASPSCPHALPSPSARLHRDELHSVFLSRASWLRSACRVWHADAAAPKGSQLFTQTQVPDRCCLPRRSGSTAVFIADSL